MTDHRQEPPEEDLTRYRLRTLEDTVRDGFARLEARLDQNMVAMRDEQRVQGERILRLEHWRERVEARNAAAAEQTSVFNSRWLPLILTLLTIGATVVYGLATST